MRTMKMSSVLAVAFVGMFVGTAHAQETMVARVPFPFVVRGEEFPAGSYEVNAEDGRVTIRGLDNGGAVFALTVSAEGSDPAGERPALVFVRDENRYRLSQVWESSDEGLAVEDPAIVARQAKAEPATTAAPTVVLVANLK